MKLIVGLGNPGPKYHHTRHNVGYEVVERLAAQCSLGKPKAKFRGEIVDAEIAGDRVLLFRPLTYMNRSGASVQAARDYFQLTNDQLLLICDCIYLPLGRLRFRSHGSSGGQKGMEDVIRRLGTKDFARLRIGIGQPPPNWDAADYVLSKFAEDELEVVRQTIERAAEGVRDWTSKGIEYCMNQYNAA